MIRTAILGASGYVGGELLRLLAAHPQIAPVEAVRGKQGGAGVGTVHPQSRPFTAARSFSASTRIRWMGSTWSSRHCLMATASGLRRRSSTKASLSSTWAPTSVSTMPRPMNAGTDMRTRRPSCWIASFTASPNSTVPRSGREISLRGRLLCDRGDPGAEAACPSRAGQPGEPDRRRGIGRQRRGTRGEGGDGLLHGHGSFSAYGLLNHRHTAEMEMALGATVLFTPHLVPMTPRHSRYLLRRSDRRRRPARSPARSLCRRAVRPCHRGPARDQVGERLQRRPLTARRDERTGRILALSAIDNLGKGAAGQMIQCANLMLGLEETAGLTTIGVYP